MCHTESATLPHPSQATGSSTGTPAGVLAERKSEAEKADDGGRDILRSEGVYRS